MSYIFTKGKIIVNQDLIDLTKDLMAAAVLNDLIIFFKSEHCPKFSKQKDGRPWVERSLFNWSQRFYLSSKSLDNLLKKLKMANLIKTKLFKVDNAPRVHICLEKNFALIPDRFESDRKNDSKNNSNYFFPAIYPKQANHFPWDLAESEKTYINSSNSSSTTTNSINREFSDLDKKKDGLTAKQKEILEKMDMSPLDWNEKSKYLAEFFTPQQQQILSYLDKCPITWEQKTQLFAFSPEKVLAAVLRTKQSKIKKTFMHCLMHACIHGLEPYATTDKIAINDAKQLQIQPYREMAQLLEKLIEGTALQGRIKAQDYYVYCDFRQLDLSPPIQANLSYFDRRYVMTMENFYQFAASKLNLPLHLGNFTSCVAKIKEKQQETPFKQSIVLGSFKKAYA